MELDLDREVAMSKHEELRGPVDVIDDHVVFEDGTLGNRKKYLVNSCLGEIVSISRPVFEHSHARCQPKARAARWLDGCGHVSALPRGYRVCETDGHARPERIAMPHNSVLLIYIGVMSIMSR